MSEYITETAVCNFDGEPGSYVKHASIDVTVKEEIVRCMDCDSYEKDNSYCDNLCQHVTPDGFCAWGERK